MEVDMRKHDLRRLVMGVVIAALWPVGPALAVNEVEPNGPISAAQALSIGSNGMAIVDGVVGVTSGAAENDVDFYSFQGTAGDVVMVDIDGGMKAPGAGRSVDTFIAIFGPGPAFKKLRENDDAGSPLDEGSIHRHDSRIVLFRLSETATYTVGVSSFPRTFRDGGVLSSSSLSGDSNGSYRLIISGVTPRLQQINIDIKPGNDEPAPINPKARGVIPVALLGSAEFDALTVDPESLTFGPTGNEKSLRRCHMQGEDVNGDGRPDVVCQFENQEARFSRGDLEGTVRGKTSAGREFEGRAPLKVVPEKH
jgi:hypothetical protein